MNSQFAVFLQEEDFCLIFGNGEAEILSRSVSKVFFVTRFVLILFYLEMAEHTTPAVTPEVVEQPTGNIPPPTPVADETPTENPSAVLEPPQSGINSEIVTDAVERATIVSLRNSLKEE